MKKKAIIVILLVVAAAVAGTFTRSTRSDEQSWNNETGEGAPGLEIRQSQQLQPGAQVEVAGINGKVLIETSDTDTAEILIERRARNQKDLDKREIIIEKTPTKLSIRAEQRKLMGIFDWGGNNAGENVTLKLPRKVALTARGVNGAVKIGEVEGALKVHGINGRVELAQALDYTEVGGVNGPVNIAVDRLGERGLKISGVNGSIELRLKEGINADLQAKGMNGGVRSELPDVVVEKDPERSKFSARIGSGGAPIAISGINGSVKLTRGAS
ncbi:MAG TPA: hypothetical protein VGB17_08585 [Pyrinomonadaceae bacterium]|jgi:hypothetical protein